MVYLFAATIFLSALLLFWIQLVMAKMLLPRLGGTPAVWNTCMLFFQVLLLAGYSYVLLITSRIGVRKQAILHGAILLLSSLYLPFLFAGNTVSETSNPALSLFVYLIGAIGLPVFLISTTSPLLQKWFTHVSTNDPYFLFAVSNGGSLVALLSYPLFLERAFTLSRQNRIWIAMYVVFLILILACMFVLWKSSHSEKAEQSRIEQLEKEQVRKRGLPPLAPASSNGGGKPLFLTCSFLSGLIIRQRLYWILLAFIPSSLLFGVTTYITTEIAPTPLLWTIPLALYLLTFILAFARKNLLPERFASTALAGLALLLTLAIVANATEPTSVIVLLHLCFLFVAGLVCHNKLAIDRPGASRLPEFYLCVAIGGMIGGLFNTLIAPSVFNTIVEYPLAIVLACVIVQRDKEINRFDFLLPACMALVTVGLALLVDRYDVSTVVAVAIVFGIPLVIINHHFRSRPVRFALALGAVMIGSVVYSEIQNRTLHDERNFFGTLSVRFDPASATRTLYHGNTIHGRQFIDPNHQCEPLSYFHRDGPLGQIFQAFNANTFSSNVAVVGLGTGSTASYARPNQDWTFYEINPAVVGIAQTTEYFTYLEKCAAAPVKIVLGDARLKLQNAPDHHYGLIVLDAFNSDAIPIHLLTEEAISLYMSKLATGGMIAFHISNRSLRLDTVLADLAKRNNSLSLRMVDGEHNPVTGKDPSEWLVMARNSPAFDTLAQKPNWRLLEGRTESVAWTDDFSNILSVFRWY
ncbi:MAG TPA: fused MFS/spermidine synthase [Pyrinomonadaceae bacterium]|nr:fused MFS/spermidine synthase [Pyrinomonadaceae bacterium]